MAERCGRRPLKRHEAILDWLRAREGAMVELLERLARAESPSREPDALAASFGILAAELERIEFLVRAAGGGGGAPHLYARPRVRPPGAPRQLVVGHMDTVWPVGTIEKMPVRRNDGRLFGPGVADMKAGLVQAVFALASLRALELAPAVTPVVFVNADEEISSPDSTRLIRLLARSATRAFVLEAAEGRGGSLKIARKGLGRFTVTARGRAAHAGADFEHGTSAILELSNQIQRLFALNDPERGVTVNVGTVDGGVGPNVVAAEATAVVDVRAPTAEEAARLQEKILGLQPTLEGSQVIAEGEFRRPPMEPDDDNRRLLDTAARLGQEVGVEVDDAGLVGGASDANTTSLFTPTLDGLGPVGGGAHAEDEHVVVRRMPERAALLALLLLEPASRS